MFKNKSLMELDSKMLNKALKIHANLQTRYIANFNEFDDRLNHEVLDKAKLILRNQYICFGILEHIQPSIQLLDVCSPKWLRLENEFPHANKSKPLQGKRFSLSEEVMEMVRHYNQYDIKLYDFALRIFRTRCKMRNISV